MERFAIEFVLRASLIVLTIALVLRALRIKSAAAQHAVWAGVLMVIMLLPAWIAWGPKAGVPVLPVQPEIVSSAAPVIANAPETPVFLETREAPAARTPVWNWDAVLLGVYLLGMFVLLLRLAVGTIRANRLTSASCASPVTVGFLRPRIILPASSVDWPQAQLDAVLTHEREHVHRRDPLFQWLALFNRAVFWFHPVAWWLEGKLSALAEEACDDAVLERGHDPHEYSECLLELARTVQQAGTRVNVVAMAMPGSGLPHRVRNIIDGVRAPRISRLRMACAGLACAIPAVAFAAGTLDHVPQMLPLGPLPAWALPQPPVLIAQASVQPTPAAKAPAPKLEFDVATIKPPTRSPNGGTAVPRIEGGPGTADPTRITYLNYSLKALLLIAYGLKSYQFSGPDWLDTPEEMFVIQAIVRQGASLDQSNQMLANLLTERFKITLHSQAKDENVYELTVLKRGPKLKESRKEGANDDDPLPRVNSGLGQIYGILEEKDGFLRLPPSLPGFYPGGPQALELRGPIQHAVGGNETIAAGLAVYLSSRSGRPVVDKTGLTGNWDFNLDYSAGTAPTSIDSPSDPAPDLIGAVRDQLGLKMESKKGSVAVLVIDHIERAPTEN